MSKRSAVRLHLSDLLAEASDFSRHAWQGSWAPMLLLTLAHTALFVSSHVAPAVWRPGGALVAAWAAMILYVPLFGSLYRTAIHGPGGKRLSLGGLQWSGVEWRLIMVGAVITTLIAFAAIPALAACGILGLAVGTQRAVALGPLGEVTVFALGAAAVWLGFCLIMAPKVAQLMLGWAYSTARGKTEPFAGLGPSHSSGWSIALCLALAWVPLLIGRLALYAVALVEGDALQPGAWPLPEAIGAGAVLGLIQTALVAPLSVGVVAGAYHLLQAHAEPTDNGGEHVAPAAAATAELRAAPYAHAPEAANDEVAPPIPAYAAVRQDAPAQNVSATALQAAREAAELDLPPSEIYRWYAADVHPAEVLAAVAQASPAAKPAPTPVSTASKPAATARTGPEALVEAARHYVGAIGVGTTVADKPQADKPEAEKPEAEKPEAEKPKDADVTWLLRAVKMREEATRKPVDVHATALDVAAAAVAAAATAHAAETARVQAVRAPPPPAATPVYPPFPETFYAFMEPGAATHAAELAYADVAPPAPVPAHQEVFYAPAVAGPLAPPPKPPEPVTLVDDPHDPHEPVPVFDALSPWPHSVLPPWPKRLISMTPDAIPVAKTRPVESDPPYIMVGEPDCGPDRRPDPRIAEITGLI